MGSYSSLGGEMTSIQLRAGLVNDAADLAALEATAVAHPWSLSAYTSSLETHQCRVLEQQQRLIGCLIYSRVLDEVELLNIVVEPSYQGAGLGGRLVDVLIDENRAEASKIFLEVRESNTPAIKLYVKKGFVLIDRRKNYYPTHNGREDALIMVYRYDG